MPSRKFVVLRDAKCRHSTTSRGRVADGTSSLSPALLHQPTSSAKGDVFLGRDTSRSCERMRARRPAVRAANCQRARKGALAPPGTFPFGHEGLVGGEGVSPSHAPCKGALLTIFTRPLTKHRFPTSLGGSVLQTALAFRATVAPPTPPDPARAASAPQTARRSSPALPGARSARRMRERARRARVC